MFEVCKFGKTLLMQRTSLRRVCGEDGGEKMQAAAAGRGLVMMVVRTMMMVMKMIMDNW